MGGGTGLWVGQGEQLHVAFFRREALRQSAPPLTPDGPALSEAAVEVLAFLRTRGAQFLTDLAAETRLTPAIIRSALWELLRRSLVTNDQFDVVRRGEEPTAGAGETRLTRASAAMPSMRSRRRGVDRRPEGRWSSAPWGRPEPEAQAVLQAARLLERVRRRCPGAGDVGSLDAVVAGPI